ncbi:MAG: iron-containing alcohol dehydrogenase [Halanaerobium sp.]
MSTYNFEFQIKTKIKFGRNKIKEIPGILKSQNSKKLMLVVDGGIKKAGILDKITTYLDSEIEYCIFDRVQPDPTLAVVSRGLEFALNEKVDSLLAVGGGSPIDTAKAIRAVFAGKNLRQNKKLAKLFLITVPTTSGSGSEVTKTIVITDGVNKHKFAATSEELAPDLTVVDPELTKTLPAHLTAVGGMDALSHCIESYVSQDAVLPFEMIATKGIEMIKENLRPAVGNPDNMEARVGMSLASLFGGIAFTNCGLGLVHAIAHPLGGRYKIPHGLANSILLPEVMRFNMISNPKKFAKIARLMGVNTVNMTEMEAARSSAAEIEKLVSDIALTTRLREFGVDDLDLIAELALKEKTMIKSNPRPVTKKDIVNILEYLV